MLNIVKPRATIERIQYTLDFDRKDGDSGYSFECTSDGKITDTDFNAYNRFIEDIYHDGEYEDGYVKKNEFIFTEAAEGICPHCGRTVILTDDYLGATSCECGQWFNIYGQELVKPEYWESGSDEIEDCYNNEDEVPLEEDM